MTPDTCVKPNRRYGALDHIRLFGKDSRRSTSSTSPVPVGPGSSTTCVWRAVVVDLETKISDLQATAFVSLRRLMHRKKLSVPRTHDRSAYQLTTPMGVLVGIGTVDASSCGAGGSHRGIHMLGGSRPSRSVPADLFGEGHRKRAFWLVAVVLGSDAYSHGDGLLRRPRSPAPSLALFLTLIISSGGNSGSQALRSSRAPWRWAGDHQGLVGHRQARGGRRAGPWVMLADWVRQSSHLGLAFGTTATTGSLSG